MKTEIIKLKRKRHRIYKIGTVFGDNMNNVLVYKNVKQKKNPRETYWMTFYVKML